MAAADGGREELHGLPGELLALCDALRGSERASLLLVVFAFFAVQLGPLGLVAGFEKGLVGTHSHD